MAGAGEPKLESYSHLELYLGISGRSGKNWLLVNRKSASKMAGRAIKVQQMKLGQEIKTLAQPADQLEQKR